MWWWKRLLMQCIIVSKYVVVLSKCLYEMKLLNKWRLMHRHEKKTHKYKYRYIYIYVYIHIFVWILKIVSLCQRTVWKEIIAMKRKSFCLKQIMKMKWFVTILRWILFKYNCAFYNLMFKRLKFIKDLYKMFS